MKNYIVEFPDSHFDPISLPEKANLSLELTATNSPILFGCRSGLCGTCLVEVEGNLPPPDGEELRALAVYADNNPKARLACQIEVCCDMKIKQIRDK